MVIASHLVMEPGSNYVGTQSLAMVNLLLSLFRPVLMYASNPAYKFVFTYLCMKDYCDKRLLLKKPSLGIKIHSTKFH